MVIPVAFNIAVFVCFGLAYGWVLHTACAAGVYRVTGGRFLDSYVLVWLIGLFSGITFIPALYLGLGFHEFGDSAAGKQLTRRLKWLAGGQIAYVCFYALLVLATVHQR